MVSEISFIFTSTWRTFFNLFDMVQSPTSVNFHLLNYVCFNKCGCFHGNSYNRWWFSLFRLGRCLAIAGPGVVGNMLMLLDRGAVLVLNTSWMMMMMIMIMIMIIFMMMTLPKKH